MRVRRSVATLSSLLLILGLVLVPTLTLAAKGKRGDRQTAQVGASKSAKSADGKIRTKASSGSSTKAVEPKAHNSKAFDPKPYVKKALQLFSQRKFAESLQIFEFLISKEPEKQVHRFNAANVKFETGDFEAAASSYREVENMPGGLILAAGIFEAKCFRKLGRYTMAEAKLFELRQNPLSEKIQSLIEDESEELQGDLNDAALDSYQKGKQSEALVLIRQSQKIGRTAEAEALEGLILLKLGHEDEGKRTLERYLAGNPSHPMRREIGLLAESLSSSRGDQSYWVTAEIGMGHNSNVLVEDGSQGTESRGQATAGVGLGSRLVEAGSYALVGGYRFYHENVFGLPEANFSTQTLSFENRWRKERMLFRISPKLSEQSLGSSLFARRMGVSASVDIKGMMFPSVVAAEYTGTTGNPGAFAYASGYGQWVRAVGTKSGEDWFAEGWMMAGQERMGDAIAGAGTVPLSYDGVGLGLNLIFRVTPKGRLENGLSYMKKNFVSLQGAPARSDDVMNVSMRWSQTVMPSWGWFASGSYWVNRSSYGPTQPQNKNFDQFIGLGGLTWEMQ